MTNERLAEIEARLAAATPRPWEGREDWEVWNAAEEPDLIAIIWGTEGGQAVSHRDAADCALIAHAPQDLADLLAEVKRLRAPLPVARTDGYNVAAEPRAMMLPRGCWVWMPMPEDVNNRDDVYDAETAAHAPQDIADLRAEVKPKDARR